MAAHAWRLRVGLGRSSGRPRLPCYAGVTDCCWILCFVRRRFGTGCRRGRTTRWRSSTLISWRGWTTRRPARRATTGTTRCGGLRCSLECSRWCMYAAVLPLGGSHVAWQHQQPGVHAQDAGMHTCITSKKHHHDHHDHHHHQQQYLHHRHQQLQQHHALASTTH